MVKGTEPDIENFKRTNELNSESVTWVSSTEKPSKREDSEKIHPVIDTIQNVKFLYFVCEFLYMTYQKNIENIEMVFKAKYTNFQDCH